MLSIPATLKIYPENLTEENAITISVFLLAIPRIGENIQITLDTYENKRVYAVTTITDVIHLPSINLNRFPKVIIEVRIMRQEPLSPNKTS
ncbi:hypothetical protein G7B40_031315 [Aetokthonos hydrillicola Thurmond2011]|jgi:hypothetical protein|uniref:Uncharacterized protein n=1 Tax=Aetokthonos hydrillicola Thurmond2011 TaxID=2712845 RepID=A0AAP5MB99_9CYAN|nr:hypothetical protein [Aetokthonos hydrillicola]MBO3463264.1 hypothetical protein [Aetokthonos hydrillicola CCALA 1050]MBW4590511.1 hypothetical protein [Aetokthonos hydrillicola CCALA 1050]MDR9899015.1 hypothetical protein [Aetokthonos hydrillicola Thurmond2011]